jgi:hypothetical protein
MFITRSNTNQSIPNTDEVLQLQFNPTLSGLCKQAVGHSYLIYDVSQEMLQEFRKEKMVTTETTFLCLKNNFEFNKSFNKYLGLGLDDTLVSKRFGLGIISDQELFFNCGTDKMLDQFLTSKNIRIPQATFEAMKKRRNAVKRYILLLLRFYFYLK